MNASIQIPFLLSLLLIESSCSKKPTVSQNLPPTFDGFSQDLHATKIVATIDEPIPDGKNAIWCASFQSAWKALQDLAGEPLELEPSSEAVTYLNRARDPRPYVPTNSLYVAVGWNQKGITNQIQSELKQRFPNRKPPTFPGILPDSFVAYAYLEANVKFSLPYDQNRRPLVFTESDGQRVKVESFGLSAENHGERDKLWDQAYVLFRKGEPSERNFEFAIDLCSNSYPNQIVVARIARESTLAGAFARIAKELGETRELTGLDAVRLHKLQFMDTLLVPDFHWAISHRFAEIEGKTFANNTLKTQPIDVAQQDLLFRLDRSGAALRSETKAYATGVPTAFSLDRPFLVYMKKRGAEMPFFVMWVDNAELMRLWQGDNDAKVVDESAKQWPRKTVLMSAGTFEP